MTTARGKKKLTNTAVDHLAAETKVYEVRDTELKGFLVRVLPSGSKMFYLDYRLNGKRNRYCIGPSCPALPVAKAREIAADKFGSVAKGVDVQVVKKQRKQLSAQEKYLTLEGLLDHKYGPWVEAHRKDGKATLRRIKATFSFLLLSRLDAIDSWTIEKWRTERLKKSIAPSTINRDLAALKAVLAKAVEWDVIPLHPLSKVKPNKLDAHKIIRFLSPDETTRLHAALEKRDVEIRALRERGNLWRQERGYDLLPPIPADHYADHLQPMVILSLNTGIRRGELFDLVWRDVDFSQKNLTIRGESAKAGKTRHIPLNQTALATLTRWQKQSKGKDDEFVFVGKEAGRLSSIKTAWGSLLSKAGIVKFRWHDMRHDFASKLVMAGVDLNTVRELLGHSDLKMTLRYAHLAPKHKAAAVEKICGGIPCV